MSDFIVGNDISKHQGDVDFEVYKKNSNFLIIKATEGVGYTDPKFSRNQSESRRVGLPLGYYHFARPDLKNSAEAEANWFIKTLGQLRDGEFLVLDYEANWGGNVVSWCKTFLDTIKAINNCKPLVYLNQALITGKNWQPVVDAGYGLWVAAYTYDPTKNTFKLGAWKFAAMQQWTNKQIVPGIVGPVDGNVFFGSVITLKKYGYRSPEPELTPLELKNLEIQKLNKAITTLQTTHANELAQVKTDCQKVLQVIKGDALKIVEKCDEGI